METSYLSDQIITYLGNKRKQLPIFADAFHDIKEPFRFADIFSGSGIVSRLAKTIPHCTSILANDWESYSCALNRCYLSNDIPDDLDNYINFLNDTRNIHQEDEYYLYGNYSPLDDSNIRENERVFYTSHNAKMIDRFRTRLEYCPEDIRRCALGSLLYKSSIHNNTCGYFNSFYKVDGKGHYGGKNENDLGRICGEIVLSRPVFYKRNDISIQVEQLDANDLVRKMSPVDVCYIDPPYNKHPYGTYYFMLNLICDWKREYPIHNNLRGQTDEWKRSLYNSFDKSDIVFRDLIEHTKSRYIWVSYNNRGLISTSKMKEILSFHGRVSECFFEHKTYNKLIGQGKKFLEKTKEPVRECFYILERRK